MESHKDVLGLQHLPWEERMEKAGLFSLGGEMVLGALAATCQYLQEVIRLYMVNIN